MAAVAFRTRSSLACALLALLASGCLPTPPPVTSVTPPKVTWNDKLAWILRLEDQRLIREPNPPAPVVLVPATRTAPQIVAPAPPTDLVRMLDDTEARVRRRAALALGRTGLAEAVEPLVTRLQQDEEFEVRQVAAFALGLIGDASARPALAAALRDPNAIVQGRAAEALGLIGDRADAPAVAAMTQAHVQAGAIATVDPDFSDESPAPAIEAVRLGLFSLARLGSYEALASVVLDASGAPVSRWWPVAYALQRVSDPRAGAPLRALLPTPGRYTASFAAKGLGALKVREAAPALRQIVDERRAPDAVQYQALHALVLLADRDSAATFRRLLGDEQAAPVIQLEAFTGLTAVNPPGTFDLLLDMLADPSPALRGEAMRALARLDPDGFLVALSGLDPDRDWSVRAAQVDAVASLPNGQGVPRLVSMLTDRDQRVVVAVLRALAAAKAPNAEQVLTERLKADDFVIRATAAAGLADIGAKGAVPALTSAWKDAYGDSTYVARAAFLGALARLDAAAARPLLEEGLKDREWAVRIRAAALLGTAVPDSATRIRPATMGRAVTDPALQALVAPPFSPRAYIDTDKGTIELELFIQDAPETVANFMALARRGFFDGIAIHRVVPDFVVQGGDPRGDGEGGPGYTIRDELNERPYVRGTVGMALDWKDTGGSQFFLTMSPQPHLEARYTVFGRVVEGMDVTDRIVQWDVIRRVRIWDGVSAAR